MHIYQSGNWHSYGSTLAYRGLREERAPRNLSICSGMVQLQSFAFSLLYLGRRHSELSLPYAMPVYLLKGRVIWQPAESSAGARIRAKFAQVRPAGCRYRRMTDFCLGRVGRAVNTICCRLARIADA